jgi:hypothetical protein
MNSAKICALIISTVALFPSASWADQLSNSQEINMNSTTTGNGRVTSIQSQQSGRYSRKSTRTTYHKINGQAASVGAISSSRKRFKKQLLNKILREQVIKQRTQIDD